MGKARRTNKRNNTNKNNKEKETTKTRERKKQKTKHDSSEEDSINHQPQQRVTILGVPCLGQKPPIVDSMKIGSSSRRANLRSSKTKNLLETGITNFSRCSRPQKSKEHFASTHATRQLDDLVESRECPMEIVASRIPSLAEKSISRVRFPTLSLGLTKFINMEVCEENEVDSQRCTMDTVEGYRVKAESMAILKKILDRHGDIAKNCTAFTVQFRSGLLEMICGIISDLQGKDLKQIKEDFLHHNIALVDDMKNMELDVEWLRVLLNDILEAKQQLGGKFGKLKEEKDINKKNIEEAERKLAECQERKRKLSAQFKEVSALLESTLDEEIVRKEALAKEKDESTKITEAIECAIFNVIRFLDCSSLDDLV